jgi:hypothetical protein
MATFEKEKVYDSATEVIIIKSVKTIKSDDNDATIFVIIY